MIIGKVLPPGSAVRRSFTFYKGEKSFLNRGFRYLVDSWLQKSFVTTDSFFGLTPTDNFPRLMKIVNLSKKAHVELMVHPWKPDEFAILIGKEFRNLIAEVQLGNFASLLTSARNQS